ncbi:MAG TPA: HupE/UreJ family protein [Longimicrobiales bacterium]|nr:HupE/UreJ family protein [Longimicrobiales bacterium]
MRKVLGWLTLLVLGVLLLPAPVFAHPGHPGESFGHGLLHPFSGADHMLAMVAVGLLAARCTGAGRWALPASFVVAMLAGGLVGLTGFGPEVASVEWVIAASVLVLGLMVSALPSVPVVTSTLIVAAFAVFHGYAHVAEMGDAMPAGFLGGMTLGTAVLHAIGLVGGLALVRRGEARYVRLAGATLALVFMVMLGIG